MKTDMLEKVESFLSNLEKIDLPVSFDLEFKARLREDIAKKAMENVPAKLLRTVYEAAGSLKDALSAREGALVRSFAAFALLSFIGVFLYALQPDYPVIVEKEGYVALRTAKSNVWSAATLATRLRAGDTIATKDGSQLDIRVSTKYAVRVKGGTKLNVATLTPRYGSGKALYKLSGGKILVSIDETFKGSRLEVETDEAVAAALGTKFTVDASGRDQKSRSAISVLEGKVEVKSSYTPESSMLAKQTVLVGAGEKTEVFRNRVPLTPQRLVEKEWEDLDELYQIGKKPQVALLIKNRPDRAKQLLKPCPIIITDEKPREIPPLLEEAVVKMREALESKDERKHIASAKLLEKIVDEHPSRKYDVQLLLFVGAYYEYLGHHKDAIKRFERIVREYPESPLASIAQCAIGIIYEEKLNEAGKAKEAYGVVIQNYPNSLEAIWVEEKLGKKATA